MKKILFSSVAATCMVLAAPPAQSQGVGLDVGGGFYGYGVFANHDSNFGGAAGAGDNLRTFDLRRDGEIDIDFSIELDNGLRLGFNTELDTEDSNNNNGSAGHQRNDEQINEAWASLLGSFGAVRLGNTDGASFLLQTEIPGADRNIDGQRQRFTVFDINGNGAQEAFRLDYAMDQAAGKEKIVYLSPRLSGFQFGVSYAPQIDTFAGIDNAVSGVETDNDAGDQEHFLDFGASYTETFGDFNSSLGFGIGHSSTETDGAAGTVGSDDRTQWNVGARLDWNHDGDTFGFGATYFHDNNGIDNNGDTRVWSIGANWQHERYTFGVSYYDREDEANYATAIGGNLGGVDVDHERLSVGVKYSLAEGVGINAFGAYLEQDEQGSASAEAWAIGTGIGLSF